jgi:hypothetical protein
VRKERIIFLLFLVFAFWFALKKPLFCQKNGKEQVAFSSLYIHRLDEPHLSVKKSNHYYEWVSSAVKPFDELILSWNAVRPRSGFFTFKISLFYKNKWSPYRKIAEWGKNVQRAFGYEGACHAHTKYVRVEMQKNSLATRFKIQITAHKGAKIKDVHGLFVSLSQLKKYKKDYSVAHLPSVFLQKVPAFTQWAGTHPRRKDFCSPTSMSMMIRYLKKTFFNAKGQDRISERELAHCADSMHDRSLDMYGNWLMNVAHAYHLTEGKMFYAVCRLNNFAALHSYLSRKLPVAVSVRGSLRGCAWPYQNGHFILVVGWDAKRRLVRCIDPAFKEVKKTGRWYHYDDFISAWGKSRNLSYVALIKDDHS